MSVYTTETHENLILVGIVIAGFCIGFVLTKLKLVTSSNIAQFATWSSCLVAAAAALASDSPTSGGLISLFGRLAIFAIVWLSFGLVFTIGLTMGLEKADKSERRRR